MWIFLNGCWLGKIRFVNFKMFWFFIFLYWIFVEENFRNIFFFYCGAVFELNFLGLFEFFLRDEEFLGTFYFTRFCRVVRGYVWECVCVCVFVCVLFWGGVCIFVCSCVFARFCICVYVCFFSSSIFLVMKGFGLIFFCRSGVVVFFSLDFVSVFRVL